MGSKNKNKNKMSRVKRKRKKTISNIIYFILFFIALIILAFSICKILLWKKDNDKIEKIDKEIKEDIKIEEKKPDETKTENVNPPDEKEESDYWKYIKMDLLNVDFTDLLKKNPDTVGWIKVNGTTINYPIVQSNDNSYYLTHAFDKTKNEAGWIFADYRNNMEEFDKNTVIYGHGRLNVTMFGSLKNILESNWYNNKDNHVIKLSTPKENTLWQVFSIYTIPAESYYITTEFYSDETYNEFLTTLKNRSKVDFSADVNINDKILTLSTCKDDLNRVVMHAKLIKKETR